MSAPTGKSLRLIGKQSEACQAPVRKIILFRFSEINDYLRASRLVQEGRSANRHQTRDGMRWTRGPAQDERGRCGRRNRAVPIPRRWDQVLRVDCSKATEANKPGTPRRPRISVNHRAGGAGVSAYLWRFFACEPRVRRASGAPCALLIFEGNDRCITRAQSRRGNAKSRPLRCQAPL